MKNRRRKMEFDEDLENKFKKRRFTFTAMKIKVAPLLSGIRDILKAVDRVVGTLAHAKPNAKMKNTG